MRRKTAPAGPKLTPTELDRWQRDEEIRMEKQFVLATVPALASDMEFEILGQYYDRSVMFGSGQ